MNLFILDEDPVESARQYCDIHTTKIILEAAGCMCAAHWEHGFPLRESSPLPLRIGQYRSASHHNNHVTQWVRESAGNYLWTAQHAIELCNEYSSRYHLRTGLHRRHASEPIVQWLADNVPFDVPHGPRAPFTLATTPECYSHDAVATYWVYYVAFKRHLTTWKWTATPWWYSMLDKMHVDGASVSDLLTAALDIRNGSYDIHESIIAERLA